MFYICIFRLAAVNKRSSQLPALGRHHFFDGVFRSDDAHRKSLSGFQFSAAALFAPSTWRAFSIRWCHQNFHWLREESSSRRKIRQSVDSFRRTFVRRFQGPCQKDTYIIVFPHFHCLDSKCLYIAREKQQLERHFGQERF